jgi:hypothetical protein
MRVNFLLNSIRNLNDLHIYCKESIEIVKNAHISQENILCSTVTTL